MLPHDRHVDPEHMKQDLAARALVLSADEVGDQSMRAERMRRLTVLMPFIHALLRAGWRRGELGHFRDEGLDVSSPSAAAFRQGHDSRAASTATIESAGRAHAELRAGDGRVRSWCTSPRSAAGTLSSC